jgi:hypothetical protein
MMTDRRGSIREKSAAVSLEQIANQCTHTEMTVRISTVRGTDPVSLPADAIAIRPKRRRKRKKRKKRRESRENPPLFLSSPPRCGETSAFYGPVGPRRR